MVNKDISVPKWQEFDKEWYCKRYSSVLPIIDDIYGGDVYLYYQEKGKKIGHSPNPFFDEKWYLIAYPDVVKAVQDKEFQSGFDHYCQKGYEDYSPHWLFSESYYKDRYSTYVNNVLNYKNGYDHYLQEGDQLLYSGSVFFNPKLLLLQCNNKAEIDEKSVPYQFFLKKLISSHKKLSVSWFFDEEWYLNTYPEVQTFVTRQVYLNGLHHYLSNLTPNIFSPLSDFSEQFYNEKYVDVTPSTGVDKALRNGYAHFISYGFNEGRKPNATLDLEQYKLQEDVVKAVSEHLFSNAFEYYVAQHKQELFKIFCDDFEQNRKQDDVSLLQSEKITKQPVVYEAEDDFTTDEAESAQSSAEKIDLKLSVQDIPLQVKEFENEDKLQFSTYTIEEDPNLFLTETAQDKVEFIDYKITPKKSEQELQDTAFVTEVLEPLTVLDSSKASWRRFDEEWYARQYSDAMAQMKAMELDSIEEYYHAFGCHQGHSPNPYFDEEWYLNTYPSVKALIAKRQFISGFDHYCQQGYFTNSPHWLFSETYYRKVNINLTDELLTRNGFVNGYDHYLRVGDREGLSGSVFFDPDFFIGRYNSPIQLGLGVYAHYLKHLDTIGGLIQTSWYFDPVWYVKQYYEVEDEIKSNKFINPLHHYLTNNTPREYSPLLWFDERFYDAQYLFLLESQDPSEHYRNGYAHFIDKGIDLLWQPSPFLNLGAYSLKKEVKQDMNKGLYPNIYVHWLANHAEVKKIEDLEEEKVEDYTDISDFEDENKDYQGALWAQFDKEWYLASYPDTLEKMEICGIETIQEYYEQIGAFLGQSPNAYFDEEWYVQHYEPVQKLIKRGVYKTGFEHYCKVGSKTYQPHWLFSSDYYLGHNPHFIYEINASEEYVDAYDHYLKKGDALRKTGSLFFDPLVYERYCYERGHVEKTSFPYRNYLLNIKGADYKATVSLYFDTGWYLNQYPEVLQQIRAGKVTSALQHYLENSTPTAFDPLPCFSEQYYIETYPDLAGAILPDGKGIFRNGYQHFLLHGIFEFRKPHPDIDLIAYYLSGSVKDDIENGFYRDVFAHWIFDQRLKAWINNLPEDSHYRLNEKTKASRLSFRKKAYLMVPNVAHNKLDFSYEGKPDISVIMLAKNQVAVTLTALASLRTNFNGKIQLLIGDNHSTDDTRFIQKSLIGAQITRFAYNFGYGRACNYLIEQVQAPITIFLNNDIFIYPGAINILCKHLMSQPDIGAVGGKIVHPDGNLQEAGSIIWRDGSTMGYLRGKDPSIAEANFVRDVDYCSAAMMAIRTDLLQRLKGFSPAYYPAYFEDTDLCIRIITAGYRVVYHPDAVVEHMEYTSSDPIVSSGLSRRNQRVFIKMHADFLRYQHPAHPDNIVLARQRAGKGKRILFIEDRVPLRRLGSGYIRSNDIIHQMVKLGYNVTVYPINDYHPHLYQIYSDIPETVEVLFDKTINHISDFFFERAGYFDAIWIGRTHNLHRILPMMGEANRYIPQDSVILDTEVIAAPRTFLRKKVLKLKDEDEDLTLEKALEAELSCARFCHAMVVVNNIDADYVKQTGFNHISILGHMMPLRVTPKTWQQRTGLLFIGALHDDLAPNFDSLIWFVKSVLPILAEKMGNEFTLTIAGYVHPSVDMSVFAQYPQIKLLGAVEDLTPLYNDHRVYIAPTRFAGGIPYKLHEAASFGIPIVAAELLVKQLGWEDDQDILAASVDNPEFFASQIIRLYQDEGLWDKLRENALSRIAIECNEDLFRNNLGQILTQVTSRK